MTKPTMKSDINLTSAPLRMWGEYLTWLSSAGTFSGSAGKHQCLLPLPDGQTLKVEAQSPESLARQVMAQLSATVSISAIADCLEQAGHVFSVQDGTPKEIAMERCYVPSVPQASQAPREAANSTKEAMQTIGVYTSKAMHEQIRKVADARDVKKSVLIRQLVKQGLDAFEGAIEDQSPKKLLEAYERKMNAYSGDSEQWMARLDRSFSLEIKLTAKEYRKSASQVVGFFVAEALSHCPEVQHIHETVAQVLTAEEVTHARETIRNVAGVKAGRLGEAIGIGNVRALVNQVLGGIARAPQSLLARMAKELKLSTEAMEAAMALNFEQAPQRSYKAPNGSPRELTEPVSWAEAVKALRLSEAEEGRLLAFEDQDESI
ncbi:hypothetical protein [Pseudomonas sp. ok266]|uniref:hypothetical protein n=1 Tax=Pseudomonas sp. ok266 TaxID=1761896 RepID=UPI0011145421|nr:hypothetical protein [Pseudomonas sp. ok266]